MIHAYTWTGPRWLKGYSVNTAFIFFTWFFFCVGQYFYKKDEKKREQRALSQMSEDGEGDLPIHDKAIGNLTVVEHVEQKK